MVEAPLAPGPRRCLSRADQAGIGHRFAEIRIPHPGQAGPRHDCRTRPGPKIGASRKGDARPPFPPARESGKGKSQWRVGFVQEEIRRIREFPALRVFAVSAKARNLSDEWPHGVPHCQATVEPFDAVGRRIEVDAPGRMREKLPCLFRSFFGKKESRIGDDGRESRWLYEGPFDPAPSDRQKLGNGGGSPGIIQYRYSPQAFGWERAINAAMHSVTSR